MLRTAVILVAVSFSIVDRCPAQSSIVIERGENRITVSIGDDLFTAFNYKETAKPFLYPVLGPGQLQMTRDFPMKKIAGESTDHPHHKSIWIGQEISGFDFWTCKRGSTIQVVGDPAIDLEKHAITANSNWVNPKGTTICSDTTTWTFGFDEHSRTIDCEFVLSASAGPITIDDSKEGTVAIRTHPDLRLKPAPKRGVKEVFGNAINSQGTEGADVWGQTASWVLYSGTIDAQPASLLILDHPKNFRHPTTWHARDYGLIAANPFGLHDFQQMAKGSGAVKLAEGQTLTLRYRFMFFDDMIDAEAAAAQFQLLQEVQPTK